MKHIFLFLVLITIMTGLYSQTPTFQWATQTGSTGYDDAWAIKPDNSGNFYVAGYFGGTVNFGDTQLISTGATDLFVGKIDTAGNWLWATRATTEGAYQFIRIAVDNNGDCYVTGEYQNTANFDNFQMSSISTHNFYVAKISSNGTWLWATHGGNGAYLFIQGIDVDNNGNSYVCGYYQQSAQVGNTALADNGHSCLFVGKFGPTGSSQWVNNPLGQATCGAISVDEVGNVLLVGDFNYTISFGDIDLNMSGTHTEDVFVVELDSEGNWLWATQSGGGVPEGNYAIERDLVDNIYVIGKFSESSNFGNSTLIADGTNPDVFVGKLSPEGTWLWARRCGGTNSEYPTSIKFNNEGNLIISGVYWGSPTFGTTVLPYVNDVSLFCAKLTSDGDWLWATSAVGNNVLYDRDMCLNTNGDIYLCGLFLDNAHFSDITLSSFGVFDMFITKLAIPTNNVDNTSPKPQNKLNGSYPNPFNSETTIRYSLKDSSPVKIDIYNTRGQHIITLSNELKSAGDQSITWNGMDKNDHLVPNGIYLCKMKAGKSTSTLKLINMK